MLTVASRSYDEQTMKLDLFHLFPLALITRGAFSESNGQDDSDGKIYASETAGKSSEYRNLPFFST